MRKIGRQPIEVDALIDAVDDRRTRECEIGKILGS